MLQTRKSNPDQPVRLMIYGVEGVGKSTLGAKSDSPVFISPEGGADQLRNTQGEAVDEITGVKNWATLTKSISDLTLEQHNFKTLVLDSADWIESLAHQSIIGNSDKSIITVNGGYGNGYRQSQSMHASLIESLKELREKRRMNIVVTAHAHVKPVKDPSMLEDYDSYEIKCHELVSSLWREWVDALLFTRFSTVIHDNEKTKRARALSDGRRVVHTVKQPSFQAKNRYGLPPEMAFTENFWAEFMSYAKKGINVEKMKNELLHRASKISDEETKVRALDFINKCQTTKEILATERRLIEIGA